MGTDLLRVVHDKTQVAVIELVLHHAATETWIYLYT